MVVLAWIIALLSAGITFIGAMTLRGYVLSTLWGWFIVPTFGAPALGIIPAIGIVMVVGQLIPRNEPKSWSEMMAEAEADKRSVKEKVQDALLALSDPFFALFIGWILYQFMPK